MGALLPAIDHITVAFTTFAEKGDTIQRFGVLVGKVLVDVAKLVFEAAYAWDWWSGQLDIFDGKIKKWVNSIDRARNIRLGLKPTIDNDALDKVLDKQVEDAKT